MCLPNDSGTKLTQTDLTRVGGIDFVAADGYQLAPNLTAAVDLSNIAPNVCAGLSTRQETDFGSYGFFICGSGDWYILEYSSQEGTPGVLVQSTNGTQVHASDYYTLVIAVNKNHLQMTVGGRTFTTENSDYTVTSQVGIWMGEEATMTTYQTAHFPASLTVSNFHYGQS